MEDRVRRGFTSTIQTHPQTTETARMKTIPLLLITAALASSALAGTTAPPESGKSNPVQPMPSATGCDCFGPGLALGVFGGALMPDNDDDNVFGGGVLGEYFFTPYFGIQGSYGLYATDSEHHQFDGSLVLRAPIPSLCIAPYLLAGGGHSTNADNQNTFHVGAGLEARFASAGCMGLFCDGIYYFSDEDEGDFTIARVGVKFHF